jgi:hypothetical protein
LVLLPGDRFLLLLVMQSPGASVLAMLAGVAGIELSMVDA